MERQGSTEKFLLTVQQASEILQVSVRTTWSMIKRKQLPHVRLGLGRGRVLVPVDQLRKWIERQVIAGDN